ncbi:MAG: 3-phosphoshikimate 1-carboxyvinyltransferase [Acidobacteria bacterium]|nr:3-phosphoshikimate 1-carboxyvinyltransferase [Acidobacteriota bacterium]
MRIRGPSRVTGALHVPGDKSISHRVAMLASIAYGSTTISGFASSADCHATLDCVRRLGIDAENANGKIMIHGHGLRGYQAQVQPVKLFVGNSGSTIRMLGGILAGQHLVSEVDGDASIRRRPMARIVEPLTLMGATINGREGNFAPLTIRGSRLRAIDYHSKVASAQVKSCVLFAGLFAEGITTVTEPAQSRNHSELMLQEFGARLELDDEADVHRYRIEGGTELTAVDYVVPGDVSSAAFFMAAATVLPDSNLRIDGVNLNPTRTAFIEVLKDLGATIQRENVTTKHFEPIGDLHISSRQLKSEKGGLILSGNIIPNLIDEIPILAIVGTQVEGRLEVRDARELRIKESDRIKTVAAGIRAMGGEIEEFEDGFAVTGPQQLSGGRIETAGDHRIAMAFSIAGLLAAGETEIIGADCAEVSFPEFYELLSTVTGGSVIADS